MTTNQRHGQETCPVSTEGWTRRVHFVREGEGGGRNGQESNGSLARPQVHQKGRPLWSAATTMTTASARQQRKSTVAEASLQHSLLTSLNTHRHPTTKPQPPAPHPPLPSLYPLSDTITCVQSTDVTFERQQGSLDDGVFLAQLRPLQSPLACRRTSDHL